MRTLFSEKSTFLPVEVDEFCLVPAPLGLADLPGDEPVTAFCLLRPTGFGSKLSAPASFQNASATFFPRSAAEVVAYPFVAPLVGRLLSSGLVFEVFDVFDVGAAVCFAPPAEALPLLAPLFATVDIVVFRACSCSCLFIIINCKFKFTNI